ncbi:hypothetical protein GUITHDRAFT_157632 [Guillardia theta CCMP2712]|uniref:NAD(P)-binding domain-containing protein n=1 Tax=Guillardia theta (strain CCMP2712) TaxID=905079 RepID=L1JH13_GUITC|nr:hypothetical protein GUITHDRAFT_157632 [Guillardia theta CCMP2712]EKX47385.1 hypothetical protein GUITHDRAFT_157632 [Guillardia theta CCMP2712]|eukprot:XP_005834365.1 hypothetical protein GUITHDRAFT_157632 [Guillardia theta CCMP2712]
MGIYRSDKPLGGQSDELSVLEAGTLPASVLVVSQVGGQHRFKAERSILITGGCGFMGSHLVDRLVLKYPQYLVVVLDVLDECSSTHHLSKVKDRPNFIFVHGDIRDSELVSVLMNDYKVDTILHLAAQTSVDHSFKSPSVFTDVNVVGTQSLLECSRRATRLRLFLYCSTDEVYGEIKEDAATEDCPLRPTNPYSASKAAAELLVMGYATSFKLPCIVTRCVNVYGSRQFPEKVIPKFAMRSNPRIGQPCCIHGDGQAKRSFIYVEDVAEAFDVVMHQGKAGNVYNIGSKDVVSVRYIADKISEAITGSAGLIQNVPDRLYNDCRYALNCSKLEGLGWKQRTPFEDGLHRTLEWGDLSGVPWSVQEMEDVEDVLRSAGVF